MLNRDLRHNERGASAIIVAASLILLIGMAAIAVDLGAGFNERRQDQTAADLGALAGALEYVSVNQTTTLQQVLGTVRVNLLAEYGNSADPNDGAWIDLWRGCSDTPPTGFNPWPLSTTMQTSGWTGFTGNAMSCISASKDTIRVRVPDQLTETAFGGAIGTDQLTTNAVAHASIRFVVGGGARPFGVVNGASTGSICLTTRSGSVPPCDGPDSGNFGTLNSQQWGDGEVGTTTNCGTPGNPELATNIALGSDHLIGLAAPWYALGSPPDFKAGDSFPADQVRLDDCTVVSGEAVHSDNTPAIGPSTALRADTGFNQFQATKAGLISGQTGDFGNVIGTPTPLLQQTSGMGSKGTRVMYEQLPGNIDTYYTLDNTPLYAHLKDVGDLPAPAQIACNKTTIAASANVPAAMTNCLTVFENGKKVGLIGSGEYIFEDTIASNPRFIFVPQFHSTTWGSGNHWQPIVRFRMAYIDTLWFNCNGSFNSTKNDTPCDDGVRAGKSVKWEPNLSLVTQICSGNGACKAQLRLDQFTAYLLPIQAAVSEDVMALFPGALRGPFDTQLTR